MDFWAAMGMEPPEDPQKFLEEFNKESKEQYEAMDYKSRIQYLMPVMLNAIVHVTIYMVKEFDLDKFNGTKKQKILITRENVDSFINKNGLPYTNEEFSQSLSNLVAEQDIIIADKNQQSFFLNMDKDGMRNIVKDHFSYKQYMNKHPKPPKKVSQSELKMEFELQKKTEKEPLRKLVFSKDENKILYFLQIHGVNFQNSVGETALNIAAIDGNTNLVRKILALPGVDVNLVYKKKGLLSNTPLISAALMGHVEILRLLVNAGADLSYQNGFLIDAFTAAAHRGNLAACQYLFREAKADPDLISKTGKFTALMQASMDGYFELVKFLLDECKADFNKTNVEGSSAFQVAAQNLHFDIADELLRRGANIDHQTEQGGTALMIAIFSNQQRAVEYLLERKCSLDIQDLCGMTPAHIAAQSGNSEALEALLKAGAKTDIKCHKGYTVYDLTSVHKQRDTKQLLANTVGKESSSVCGKCGKEGMNFKVCSRCRSVKYCAVACQKSHWKEHKKVCKNKNDIAESYRESLPEKFNVDMTVYEHPNPSWAKGPPMYVGIDGISALWMRTRTCMGLVIPTEIESAQMYITCGNIECNEPEHVRFVKARRRRDL